jgi:hypothetical protein
VHSNWFSDQTYYLFNTKWIHFGRYDQWTTSAGCADLDYALVVTLDSDGSTMDWSSWITLYSNGRLRLYSEDETLQSLTFTFTATNDEGNSATFSYGVTVDESCESPYDSIYCSNNCGISYD